MSSNILLLDNGQSTVAHPGGVTHSNPNLDSSPKPKLGL